MKPRRLAGLLLAGAMLAAVGLIAAAPANAAAPFTIRSSGNGKCLQPELGSTELGAAIVQEPCDGSAAQNWTRAYDYTTDTFQFRNEGSQLCLDARGGAADGTPAQQWTCNWISNEKWQMFTETLPAIDHIWSRVAGSSSYCLHNPGGSQDGAAMDIIFCNANPADIIWWVG